MDDEIYIVKLSWLPSEKDGSYDSIPGVDICFPQYRRFIKELPFHSDMICGWTVFIQNFEFYNEHETLAYLRYAAWEYVPLGTCVGQSIIIWRSPYVISAKGTIVGVVTDNVKKKELLKWQANKHTK